MSDRSAIPQDGQAELAFELYSAKDALREMSFEAPEDWRVDRHRHRVLGPGIYERSCVDPFCLGCGQRRFPLPATLYRVAEHLLYFTHKCNKRCDRECAWHGEVWPSLATLGERLGIADVRTLRRYMRALEACGVLRLLEEQYKRRTKTGHKYSSRVYAFMAGRIERHAEQIARVITAPQLDELRDRLKNHTDGSALCAQIGRKLETKKVDRATRVRQQVAALTAWCHYRGLEPPEG